MAKYLIVVWRISMLICLSVPSLGTQAAETPAAQEVTKPKPLDVAREKGPRNGQSFTSKFPRGRIAITSDGNIHDKDDFGATAMSLAMLHYAGLGDKLVHCDFSNHLGKSTPSGDAAMIESALGGAERFKLDRTKFFNDQTQLEAAIANFKAEGNKSSADNPLWFICAGPMETAWRCINAVDPEKRKYIYCISHSNWNDSHGDTPEMTHTWDDLGRLGATLIHITDQNGSNEDNDFNTSEANWLWLKESSNPDWQWLFSRNVKNTFDVSDAGMTWWLISGGPKGGDERAGWAETRALFDPTYKYERPKTTPEADPTAPRTLNRPLDRIKSQEARNAQNFQSRWRFDQDEIATLPMNWKSAMTGPGTRGKWQVIPDPDGSQFGRSMAMVESTNRGNTFNLLLAEDSKAKDLTLQVDFKLLGGTEDRGAGVVWRVQDENNYYLARWNVGENFRVYVTKAGKRTLIAEAKIEFDPAVWHELEIQQCGNRILAEVDDTALIDVEEATLTEAGMVGLWTKADATAVFDDIRLSGPGLRVCHPKGKNRIVVNDPLKGSSLGTVTGGKFVEDGGWTVVVGGDRIVWKLPEMGPNAILELDIRNLDPQLQANTDRINFLGLWGYLFANMERQKRTLAVPDTDGFEMRMGNNSPKYKLEYHSFGIGKVVWWTPIEKYDLNHTYHLKIEWRGGVVTTWMDDKKCVFEEGCSPDDPIDHFNFLHLGTSPTFGNQAALGPIYSNLKITEINE